METSNGTHNTNETETVVFRLLLVELRTGRVEDVTKTGVDLDDGRFAWPTMMFEVHESREAFEDALESDEAPLSLGRSGHDLVFADEVTTQLKSFGVCDGCGEPLTG